MAQRKILSERYLSFLGKHGRSALSGSRGVIELHHESVFQGFRGGRKKYNDFQAIPLTKQEHTDRHTYGLKWWEDNGVEPEDIVRDLLQEYLSNLSPFSFKDDIEYQNELELVLEHLSELGVDLHSEYI